MQRGSDIWLSVCARGRTVEDSMLEIEDSRGWAWDSFLETRSKEKDTKDGNSNMVQSLSEGNDL